MSNVYPQYWASENAEVAARTLRTRSEQWFRQLNTNGFLMKLEDSWRAYHGFYYRDNSGGHKITFGGEQGELVNLAVNDYRNLGQHILTMITSSRPSLQPRASNTDYKSLVQTKLAGGLLDYYMRQKRLERYFKKATEYAIVLSAGYIKMDWNANIGEMYDYNEETKIPVYEGDVEFMNLSPFDVVFDNSKEDSNHDWVLTRTWKNKYDLAAKFPEHERKIIGLATKDERYRFRINVFMGDATEDVPVYEFYHRRTESMPDGRYLMYLDDDIVLMDSPMPYRSLPVYRIAPSDILGTPYGYTPMFDILPIQDALNSLYSVIFTNQHAFGVQNIYVPRGADVVMSQLAGGLNIIEGNAQAGKPEPLNLTDTPAEVFKFIEMLETKQETLSGVNSVARGNPEASLKSGSALALVQSMALQFISGLQQSYVELIEDVATGLIHMLQDFASAPRVAAISGQANRSKMKSFTGEDLSLIDRVIVDVGNPLSKTTAGRLQLAENLIQYGLLTNPQDYITIINTGNLDVATDNVQDQVLLTQAENEKLINNEHVIALATDDHPNHIKSHRGILSDPDLRMEPDLVKRVLGHIQEHINLERTTDPDLLKILGIQPLGPQGGSPANQPQPQGMQPTGNPDQMQNPQAVPQPGEGQMQGPGMQQPVNMPNMPKPPAPFENAPTNSQEMIKQ